MKFHLSTLLLGIALICLALAWIVERGSRIDKEISLIEGTGIWHEAMMLNSLSYYKSPELELNIERKRVRMVIRLYRAQDELSSFTRFADANELLERGGTPPKLVSLMNENYTPEQMTATTLSCLGCNMAEDYFGIFSKLGFDEIRPELGVDGHSHQEFRSFLGRALGQSE